MRLMEEIRRVLSHASLACALTGCSVASAPIETTAVELSTGVHGEASSSGSTAPVDEPTPTTTDVTTSTSGFTTESSSTTDSSSTTGIAALCGNGVLDPGETCDNAPHNWDQGACTSQCQKATCGDGLLFVGVETCDEGADNAPGYGHCDPVTCQPGPSCGDGKLDPEEECDGGDPENGGMIEGADVPCQPGCAWDGRLAFISSLTYDGDLGGLPGADLKCRLLAEAQNFHDAVRFKAWLSDAEDDPLGRFDFTPDPIVLPTGLLVAEDLAALLSDGPGDGIRSTEAGVTLLEAYVWTNTADTGAGFSGTDHCGSWTSAAKQQKARVGYNAAPKQPPGAWQTWHDERHWTSYDSYFCNYPVHIYCIED